MDYRDKYRKEIKNEVTSVHHQDREKIYHDSNFIEELNHLDPNISKVTEKDLRKGKRNEFKKSSLDENTRVFNLKWARDPAAKATTQE